MMKYAKDESEATLEDVLASASTGNEVLITHSDGNIYAIRKLNGASRSAFDQLGIPHIANNLTVDEIVQLVRESRQRVWDSDINAYHEGPWPGDADSSSEE